MKNKMTGRDFTRILNGFNQRLEAAFLLLSLCPRCGANCRVTANQAWEIWCPKHGIVSTRTKMELWNALDPAIGAMTE